MAAITRKTHDYIAQLKQEVQAEIVRDIRARGLTNARFRQNCGLCESDAALVIHGQLDRFSLQRLIAVLVSLGHEPRITVSNVPEVAA